MAGKKTKADMPYSDLADIYEELEKTPAKLKKTDIVSKLLKSAPAEILPKIVLMLQGIVFPRWSETELGVANQLMIKAITKAAGVKEADVVKKFKDTGDLGLTAESFVAKRTQRSLLAERLTVDKVFETIRKIASQAGAGSQERKLALIAELLIAAKPKEARYIVRTVLEELRVGVAEGIVRDAIAKTFGVDVDELEATWQLNQDYGELARLLRKHGKAGLKKVKIKLGTPTAVLLAEKSPSLEEALKEFERPAIEFKYDGMRAAVHKKGEEIWVFTRRLENVTKQFPDIVDLIKKSIKAKECIIEGEALGIDPKTKRAFPFQRLSERIHRKYDIEKMVREIPIQLNLFDIVYLNGKMLFDQPLAKRRAILEKIVKEIPGKLQLAEQLVTKDLKKAEAFYQNALDAGQEGVLVKNLDAKYVPGRRVAGGWLKVKPILETIDVCIVGATWGTGKRAGWLGSYVLGVRDPETGRFLECGMLGTGVKEKKTKPEDVTFADLTKMLRPHIEFEKGGYVKIKPKVVIEVAAEEIQKSPNYASGFALRFPRFQRLRPDKSPADSDSVERLEKLFAQQKGKGAR